MKNRYDIQVTWNFVSIHKREPGHTDIFFRINGLNVYRATVVMYADLDFGTNPNNPEGDRFI
jgi:hypothetical protein